MQARNAIPLKALQAIAETKWSCGYSDDALDVAVHVRRGDLYVASP